jgi:hypothetical protein
MTFCIQDKSGLGPVFECFALKAGRGWSVFARNLDLGESWDDVNNWSGGSVPVNSDVVHLDHPNTQILHGLAQSAVTLAELHTYDAVIGLKEQSDYGYPEYRARYLAIGATSLVVGEGGGQGSRRQKIDLGSVQSTVRVLNSGAGDERPYPAIILKGTHASNAAYLSRGSVGFAVFGGEAATVATLEAGYQTSQQSDVQCLCGSGVTLTTLQQTGGTVTFRYKRPRNLPGVSVVAECSANLVTWQPAPSVVTASDAEFDTLESTASTAAPCFWRVRFETAP